MRIVIALCTGALLLAVPAAGTVTLTGGCSGSGRVNSSYISFDLANSGNDTAANMTVVPDFPGLSPYNSVETVAALGPSNSTLLTFYFAAAPYPGGYAGAFFVTYMEGIQTFSATFPCSGMSVGHVAQSRVFVANVTRNPSGTIQALVLNPYASRMNVTVYPFLPLEFNVSPMNQTVSVPALSRSYVTFNMSGRQAKDTSFSAGIGVSYVLNDTHYSMVSIFKLNYQPTLLGAVTPYVPYVIVGVAVLVIVALVVASVVHSHGKKEDGKHEKTVHNDGNTNPQ